MITIILGLFCLFFILYKRYKRISYHIQNERLIKKNTPFNPSNTLLVFDLHGVVFNHDYKQMIKTFLKSHQKGQVILQLLHPCLLRDIFKVVHRNVPEAFFIHMAYHYASIQNIIPLLIKIGNCQKVCYPATQLLKELKQLGYSLAVLSNIGQHMLEDFQHQHPDIFKLFDHIMVATPDTGYLSKPNPAIYKHFIRVCNQEKKHIILIDDKLNNLQAALPFNIMGILFSNSEQCKQELINMHILPH